VGSIVITTIQTPTSSVVEMVAKGRQSGLQTIVIGDRKTPSATWPENVDFISITDQFELSFSLATKLPENHYSRKNIGYLVALSRQTPFIFDTDDDNAPLASWKPRSFNTSARICKERGWINAYRWFSDDYIWPRGYPLEHTRHGTEMKITGALTEVTAPIQQGLSNGSPDVDAVWRLLQDQEITFSFAESVYLHAGAWCPFNSQCTWWFPEAYPLMYLPSFVSFRMTDIWRSFVAQRCLWAMGYGVVFHGPEMYQVRNPHNLLRDFEQEIPGYLGNSKICDHLAGLKLSEKSGDAGDNLHRCYETLIATKFIPVDEIVLVEAWLKDISGCLTKGGYGAVKRA